LPSTLLKYVWVWNASTNTPTLTANDTTKKWYVYNVWTAWVQFGISWSLWDWAIYNDNGDIEKSDNSDDVVSVNGQTGTVVLKTDDISDTGQTNKYVTSTQKTNRDTAYGRWNHADAWYLKLDQTTPQTIINGSPIFNVGIQTPKLFPITDSTTAIQIMKADGITNILTVDTTNSRVGIGTTSPGTKLDIATASSNNNIALSLYRGDVTGRLISFMPAGFGDVGLGSNEVYQKITFGSSGASLGSAVLFSAENSQRFLFNTGGSTRLTILNTGNVGIGTTAPENLFTVVGDSGVISKIRANSIANDSTAILQFTSSTGTVATGGRIVGIRTNNPSSESYALTFQTTLDSSNRFSERMRIDPSGNVGIGTTTPNSKLQVAGSVSFPYVEKTANYTLDATDYTVNCTANSFTITLPTAANIAGRIYTIKNSGTGIITVNTTSGQTIDWFATMILSVQYDVLAVMSTGTSWIILR